MSELPDHGPSVWVTVAHLRDAITAGLSPLREELHHVGDEVRHLRVDVDRLARRIDDRPVQRWAAARAANLIDRGLVLAAAAAGGALAAFLLDRLF